MTDQGSYVALSASWADDPWFRFPRAFIRDARLSATARAIAAWMASHSTRFRFDVTTMMKANLGGRDKVRKALKELEKYGYLVRTRERNSDGTMGRILYELHPVPQENPSSAPAPENQSVAPGTENQSLDMTSGNAANSQVATGDWKPGPGFQEGYKREQPQVEQEKKEGEEGDARARVTGEPSAGDEPVWGVSGGADFVAPTLASANLIRQIAGKLLRPGEELSAEEHQRLATLVEKARPVVEAQPGLSWEEYEAWLKQDWVRPDGRRTFRTLPGALGWRLLPEQVRKVAWPWACEQRGAQEPSEARGERDVPQPRGGARTGTCGVHGVQTFEGTCAVCERENAEEAERYKQAAAPEAASDVDGPEHEDAPAPPEDVEDPGDESEAEFAEQMRADLAEAERRAAQDRERELAGLKAMFERTRAGAAVEEKARLSKHR
ncbi:hypothetical protein ACIBFB_26555 [Nocardiopsis sp. NPDC050513]|uniref:hypothetical protein n=1 Tax=Nocardiopsis sp. NPDC050513 TaxID=3364338 RepID=UPI00378E7E41